MPAFPLDTGYDLRDKIEWGLDPEDIPELYRAEWRIIAELYQRLDEQCTAFYAGLPADDAE